MCVNLIDPSISPNTSSKSVANNVQDVCVDVNGNIYIAYESSIRAFNKNLDFIWFHEFDVYRPDAKSGIDYLNCSRVEVAKKLNEIHGRLMKICVSKTGALLCVTQEDKDASRCRCYVFA